MRFPNGEIPCNHEVLGMRDSGSFDGHGRRSTRTPYHRSQLPAVRNLKLSLSGAKVMIDALAGPLAGIQNRQKS